MGTILFLVAIQYLLSPVTLQHVAETNNNPCNPENHQLFNPTNIHQRSTGNIVPKDSKSLGCDSRMRVNLWYRFSSPAGNEIPTQCPPLYSCGTKNPIWLDDQHPTDYNIPKNVKACVNAGTDCCFESIQIQTAKCKDNANEDFFVYKLARLELACPFQYCIGSGTRCPTDQTSETGFTPCTAKFPKLKSDPFVTVDVHDSRMRFVCSFEPEVIKNNNQYNVTWYGVTSDGQPQVLFEEMLQSAETKSYLQNTNSKRRQQTFCLNQDIFCEVRSYFVGNEKDGVVKRSNNFYAGIKVSPTSLKLSESDPPTELTFTSTVPIVCNKDTENCGVTLRIAQKENLDGALEFCSLSFEPGEAGQTKTMKVAALRDFRNDGDKALKIKFKIPITPNPLDWDCHPNIPDVTVLTKDVTTAQCQSTGDPHIRTFDGRYFDHYKVGDYVLVKSEARLFEVHVRTFQCWSVSCNCAVAAREGDDVMVVDMCRDRVPRARFASTVEPQPGSIMEMSPNGKTFVFNFPSGASVKFQANSWGANVYVQLPPDDYGKTKGLCGIWNGDRSDDLTSKDGREFQGRGIANVGFTESWRFQTGTRDSLFYYKGPTERKCLAERVRNYCSCNDIDGDKDISCNFDGLKDKPKYIVANQGYAELKFPGADHCGKRRRRRRRNTDAEEQQERPVIILPDEDPETAIYDYNPKQLTAPPPSFPTKTGITEQQAVDGCEKALRDSTSGKICLEVLPDFDVSAFKEQCVADIMILGDMKVPQASAVEAMKEECEEKTLKNITLWESDDSGVLQPPQAVGNALCPSDCSGNGKCVNSTCLCNGGFLAADCSIHEDDPPTLVGIPLNNGLCNIRYQNCLRTRVIGRNFVNSAKLTCGTKTLTFDSNLKPEQPVASVLRTSRSQMLSFAELSCEIPTQQLPLVDIDFSSTRKGKPIGGVSIQLSNDGYAFSKNISKFVVYDSKCIQCADEDNCRWKVDSCRVNNYCLAVDEPHSMDWCQICRGNNTFIERSDNLAPVFRSGSAQKVFNGQTLRFAVPVADPEQKKLVYNFVGIIPKNMEISTAGIITWKPIKANESYNVTIKASDICGNTSQATYKFESVNCLCEELNGAKCGAYPDESCQCPKGCMGENCTDPIPNQHCRIMKTPGGQEEEPKKSYFNLECQSNGLKAAFNLSHLERHGLPYIVRFKGKDHDCKPLNTTYGNINGDDKLWIAANYSDCGIRAYEEGSKILFEQTILVEYGTKMDSSLVYRQFVDTYNATCLIERNITRQWNISVTKRKTLSSEEDDESEFAFDFNILKAGTNAWTGLIYVGEKMDFDLSLNGASNSIKTSPQDCYATRLDGTGRYDLIKDRCSVGGETSVTITTTPQDTREFSWEMEAFRYFGDSDGIIITCRILICRNRPIDQLSEECRRCGQKAPLRRKRNVDNDNEDSDNVLTDKSVKSRPIFIAERSMPKDQRPSEKSRENSSSDGLGLAEKITIIAVAGIVGFVLCIAVIKKVFFNRPSKMQN
ncbi:von Willebrand factor D and EGF domain-containing protein-like [Clytia hemisphaerica]|uniref:Uncharacterized protein n=1 Tax=Clytia hemisphaerica TaxID=252671 RepID=A0A7M5X0E8_9CNID